MVFEKVRKSIFYNRIPVGIQKDSIEIIRSRNLVCKYNILYAIAQLWMNILKLSQDA